MVIARRSVSALRGVPGVVGSVLVGGLSGSGLVREGESETCSSFELELDGLLWGMLSVRTHTGSDEGNLTSIQKNWD